MIDILTAEIIYKNTTDIFVVHSQFKMKEYRIMDKDEGNCYLCYNDQQCSVHDLTVLNSLYQQCSVHELTVLNSLYQHTVSRDPCHIQSFFGEKWILAFETRKENIYIIHSSQIFCSITQLLLIYSRWNSKKPTIINCSRCISNQTKIEFLYNCETNK